MSLLSNISQSLTILKFLKILKAFVSNIIYKTWYLIGLKLIKLILGWTGPFFTAFRDKNITRLKYMLWEFWIKIKHRGWHHWITGPGRHQSLNICQCFERCSSCWFRCWYSSLPLVHCWLISVDGMEFIIWSVMFATINLLRIIISIYYFSLQCSMSNDKKKCWNVDLNGRKIN